MSKAPAPPKPAAERLRAEIEQALADGQSIDSLTLRLTHGDASAIKRDPRMDLNDVSFTDGEMRFLGVAVVQGGVTRSQLDRGGDVSQD